MLIIGRANSAQINQGNTLEALNSSVQAGIDILELAIGLTKDNVPIVVHTPHDSKHHTSLEVINRSTFRELFDRSKECPVVPLSQILDEFFGNVLLNIKLKGSGTGETVVRFLDSSYIKRKDDWDNLILSSFKWKELAAARRISSNVNLALLQSKNPFAFTVHYRRLKLAAVGFHRLYVNSFALEIAKRTGLFTYVYTVNRPGTAVKLAQKGIDGIVTDRPESILRELEKRSSRNF
jgi:glycerophosphoryl diester phosphodiesterase